MFFTKKNFVFLMLNCLVGSIFNSVLASTLFDNTEFSIAAGPSRIQTNNSQLFISPYETDSLLVNHLTNSISEKIGVGKKFLNRFLIELNLYRDSGSINGNVLQFQLPQFNNYTFQQTVHTTRFMADLKPDLFLWKNISPYPILGLGMAWSDVNYNETLTNNDMDAASAISLSSKRNSNFAYDLGFGLRVGLTQKMSASLEYIYTHIGNVSAANSLQNGLRVMSSPIFTIRNQSILCGIIFKLG